MKLFKLFLILPLLYLLSACESEPEEVTLSINLGYYWGNEKIVLEDLNQFKFTNSADNQISISDVKFIISDLKFNNQNSYSYQFNNYFELSNITNSPFSFENNVFSGRIINSGSIKVNFDFGYTNSQGSNNEPLNLVDWEWPEELGGGYYTMKFSGNFIDTSGNEKSFEYFMGPQVKFSVELNEFDLDENTAIELKMDLKEWFNNPVPWNLNTRHIDLMEDPDIQMAMKQNGQTVFSIRKVN